MTIWLLCQFPIKCRQASKISYFTEKDGKPVNDLEPYLAAPMHIAVVRADLGRFIHTHGEIIPLGSIAFQRFFKGQTKFHSHFIPDRFGPIIPATITFPQGGLYKIFGEFKHQGKIIVSEFAVKVE